MAAALEQQAICDGTPHRLAEIDAGDGAARAGADAGRVDGDGKTGAAVALLQSRGDEADDAGVPAFRGGHDHRTLLLQTERRHRLRFGLRERLLLDPLTLGVETIELGGNARGLYRIAFHEQARAEIGTADAAAGIDAR